ncbi:putative holin-like toxin [Alicyclobacillus acidocaldarius]|nr:putative holin-like toxin [Alicyclobacillus acidocaldarius]
MSVADAIALMVQFGSFVVSLVTLVVTLVRKHK